MRVLIMCSSLEVGGAERHVAVLAPALAARGFDVSVTVLKHEGRFVDELRDAGVPVQSPRMTSRFDVRGARRALAAVEPRPDVVISQTVNAQVLGHVIARRARVPHMTIEHAGLGLGMTKHRRALVRLVAARVDAAVAVSETQLPELVTAGYRRDRIRVIPNGVPVPVVSRASREVRAELGLAPSDFVAILVASLRPEKRVGSFVDAVSEANRTESRVRGLVAGGGASLESLRERAAAANGAVTLLGERHDVADLMAASDLVCLTSRTEGLPVTVLEAMALDRAVVATAVGGIPGVVKDGLTGVLVDPGDDDAFAGVLVRLSHEPELLGAMGRAAGELYAGAYTVDHMADSYAELLRALGERRAL
jgi:glycosyltransferase involved in cell wall biosynthesis